MNPEEEEAGLGDRSDLSFPDSEPRPFRNEQARDVLSKFRDWNIEGIKITTDDVMDIKSDKNVAELVQNDI